MTDALLPLTICVAIGLLWYDALRARELAIAHALRLCREYGAQLLDESVALHRLRPLLRGRPQLLRSYRFDLSYTGNDRHRASLTLAGGHLLDYSLPTPEAPHLGAPPSMAPVTRALPADVNSDNVVPITRARRTLH